MASRKPATASEKGRIYYQDQLRTSNLNDVQIKTPNNLVINIDAPFHPTDAELTKFAAIVYKKNEIENGSIPEQLLEYDLRDWILHSWAENIDDKYFGATFYNPETSQVVISHCGAISNKEYMRSIYGYTQGAVDNQLRGQVHSACTYCALVLQELDPSIFRVSITGHSLGGWLAEVTTFTSEYLELNSDKQFERKMKNPNYQVHTVAFDPPGCYEELCLISDSYYPNYEEEAYNMISALDITIYFYAPNYFNCFNTHRGISRLLQILNESSECFDVETHDINNFVEMMKSENVKTVTVTKWPTIDSPDYVKKRMIKKEAESFESSFFHPWISKLIGFGRSYASKLDVAQLPHHDVYDKGIVNYKTIPNNEKIRDSSIFSINELHFLKIWQEFQIGNTTPKKLKDVVGRDFLPDFEIKQVHGREVISCNSKNDIEKIINRVKNILRKEPELHRIIKESGEVTKIYETLYQTFSKNYVQKIPKYKIEFEDTIGLGKFLELGECIFCLITQQDTINEIFRIRNLLQRFKIDEDKQCFLGLSELKELNEYADVNTIFKNPNCVIDQYLIIDCEMGNDSDEMSIVRKLAETAASCETKKKLILVAQGEISFCKSNYVTGTGYLFTDFDKNTQRKLLNQKIFTMHNKELNLSTFLGKRLSDVKKFFSKPDGINFLIRNKLKIELCSRNIVNLDDVKIRVLKVYENVEDDKVKNFVNEVNKKKNIFVVSGGSTTDFKSRIPGSSFPLILPVKDDPEDFYGICREHWENKIYWFHLSPDSIEFREVFDSDFYIDRHFYPQIILKDESLTESNRVENETETRNVGPNRKSRYVVTHGHEIITPDLSRHRAVFEPYGEIIWRSSTGSIDRIREIAWRNDAVILSESQFNQNEKVTIIADEPAMGKSSTLLNIAKKMSNTWIIWTNLISFRKNMMDLPVNLSICDIIEFLQKTNENLSNPLVESMLEYNLQCEAPIPLALFFDGFDEVNKETRDKIVKIFKYIKEKTRASLWVTTRIWAKDILENELSTFAIKMKEITEEEQLKLITNIWQSRLMCTNTHQSDLSGIGKEVLKQVEKTLVFDQIITRPVQEALKKKLGYFLENCMILNEAINATNPRELYFKLQKDPERRYQKLQDEIWGLVKNFEQSQEQKEIFCDFLSWAWCLNKAQNLFVQKMLQDEKMRDILMTSHNQLDNNSTNHFMGIPLQLRMIAEIVQLKYYSDKIHKTFNTFVEDFYDLYREFFSKRIRVFFKELGLRRRYYNDVNEVALIKKHECLAFQLLFPKQAENLLDDDEIFILNMERLFQEDAINLNQIGYVQIFETGEFQFVHQSFAEYFAAHKILHLMKRMPKKWSHPELRELVEKEILLKEDHVIVRRFLNDYLNVNKDCEIFEFLRSDFKYEKGPTPLHVAITERNEQLAVKLLDVFGTGHCVDAIDDQGITILYLAVFQSFPKLIKKILRLSPQKYIWEIKYGDDDTYFLTHSYTDMRIIHSKDNNVRIIDDSKEILEIGNFEISSDSNLSGLLFCAAINNKWDLFRKLTKAFPTQFSKTINWKEPKFGKTLLHFAAQKNQIEIAEYLISEGANIIAVDNYGIKPEEEAEAYENWDIAKMIADHQRNINSRGTSNDAALHLAIYNQAATTSRQKR